MVITHTFKEIRTASIMQYSNINTDNIIYITIGFIFIRTVRKILPKSGISVVLFAELLGFDIFHLHDVL